VLSNCIKCWLSRQIILSILTSSCGVVAF
jgi:hypothetical protein